MLFRSARFALRVYSDRALLSIRGQKPELVEERLDENLRTLLLSPNSADAATLLLKMFRNRAGVDVMYTLMTMPPTVAPWIDCNRDMVKQCSVSLADPFPVILDKAAYEATCGALRMGVSSAKAPKIPNTNHPKAPQNVMAGLFSQLVLTGLPPDCTDSKLTKLLEQWQDQLGLGTNPMLTKAELPFTWLGRMAKGQYVDLFPRDSTRGDRKSVV